MNTTPGTTSDPVVVTTPPDARTLAVRRPGPEPSTAGCLSLRELSAADQAELVARSVALYRGARPELVLSGRSVGVLFTKTSTRTRTAFTVGAIRLGAVPITYGPADLQTATGESLADTGRVLGSMLDVLVARTAGPQRDLRELAAHAGIPVINAMTAEEHPTQGLCDVAVLALHGLTAGVRLLYVGEGNNSAVALALAAALIPGVEITFATPAGYGLPSGVLEAARHRAVDARVGAQLREVHDMAALPDRVDVVYTTRWQTTGTTKPDAAWREVFDPFRVRPELMGRWPDAALLHDLPAHRGEEVFGETLDGPRSLAWDQARMKLYGAMALLERAVAPGSR